MDQFKPKPTFDPRNKDAANGITSRHLSAQS